MRNPAGWSRASDFRLADSRVHSPSLCSGSGAGEQRARPRSCPAAGSLLGAAAAAPARPQRWIRRPPRTCGRAAAPPRPAPAPRSPAPARGSRLGAPAPPRPYLAGAAAGPGRARGRAALRARAHPEPHPPPEPRDSPGRARLGHSCACVSGGGGARAAVRTGGGAAAQSGRREGGTRGIPREASGSRKTYLACPTALSKRSWNSVSLAAVSTALGSLFSSLSEWKAFSRYPALP